MSIFALLVIPDFNKFLPADGVCPMAHRSALWWGLPIQLHGVEGKGKFTVSQSQNLVKFSWRWRIQEMKKPQVLVIALATKLVRWLGFFSSSHCSSYSWNMTVPTWLFKMPTFCPLCEIAAPVRKVTIRGLCEQSIFDKWDKFLIHVDLN